MKLFKLLLILPVLYSCKQHNHTVTGAKTPVTIVTQKKSLCCESNIPSRFASLRSENPVNTLIAHGISNTHKGMTWIKPGTFIMGGNNKQAAADEYPRHKTTVHGFWMDTTVVTNAQFARFVKATGYVTIAERKPDWNQLKKQLPPGTPKPPDSVLVAASLVFDPPKEAVDLNDYTQWWAWKKAPTGGIRTVQGVP